MSFIHRTLLTGLLVLVPAWGTFLILRALFSALDSVLVDLLGQQVSSQIPGLGLLSLLGLILLVGMLTAHVLGQWFVRGVEAWVQRVPIVKSVYLTLKGMTDLFNYRERFGQASVAVFPFPRPGVWALGFIMGDTPRAVQSALVEPTLMLFVPTAIHPFTGYLAFIPAQSVQRVAVRPEEAIKVEFSAGLYRPAGNWLVTSEPSRSSGGG
jgi:uncharacterized membrane protein